MNDSMNSSKGLLVIHAPEFTTKEQAAEMGWTAATLADKLGLESLVVPYGTEVRIETSSQALLERVCVALEALVAQGTPPSVSPQEEAPQALNARQAVKTYVEVQTMNGKPTRLNTRG